LGGRISQDALHGRWVHSHEEDTNGEMVFRPATHPLPPSRGRTSFELRPDGTYVESSPGPVDVPEETKGSWSLEGDRLMLRAEDDRPGHAWEITTAEDDRLGFRK
jgi:hypothetical protein